MKIKISYHSLKSSKFSKNMPAFRVQMAHSLFLQSSRVLPPPPPPPFAYLMTHITCMGCYVPSSMTSMKYVHWVLYWHKKMKNAFISVYVLLKCSVWTKSWATEQEQTKPSVGPGKLNVPKGRNLTKRKTPEADLEWIWSSAFKNMYLLLCVCGWGCHGGHGMNLPLMCY